MIDLVLPIIIISTLILLNGLFVASEFSIIGVPQTRLANLAQSGASAASRVFARLKDLNLQNRYIATAQVGITFASLGLGMYGEHIVSNWFMIPMSRIVWLSEIAAHTLAIVLAIVLLTYLHVVFGEMVPKSLALYSPLSSVLWLEKPMTLFENIFHPIVLVLNNIGNAVLKIMRIPPATAKSRVLTTDELEIIVEESYEGGLLEADEQLFIENIFDLSERTVKQVMTPRTRIVGIPAGADEKTVLDLVCQAHYTRYPIYEDDLDQITGILHIKNLARQQIHPESPFDITHLASSPIFIPESLSIEEVIVRFRQKGTQMAIVFDEFGGTAGLVTLEDLVEEVVGEIQDEFDQELPPIQTLEPGRLRVRGDLLLDELNQHHDLKLSHPDADTVGGLLMALLGRMLDEGDVVESESVRFEVESVKGLAVQTVLVELPTTGGALQDNSQEN